MWVCTLLSSHSDDSLAEVTRGHSPQGGRRVYRAPVRQFIYHLSGVPKNAMTVVSDIDLRLY
jgi:hypothetical protein